MNPNSRVFFIRTATVGPELSPDLLTLPLAGARGLYRRWGLSPALTATPLTALRY